MKEFEGTISMTHEELIKVVQNATRIGGCLASIYGLLEGIGETDDDRREFVEKIEKAGEAINDVGKTSAQVIDDLIEKKLQERDNEQRNKN